MILQHNTTHSIENFQAISASPADIIVAHKESLAEEESARPGFRYRG